MVIDDFPGLFPPSSSATCKIIFSLTEVMGKLSIFSVKKSRKKDESLLNAQIHINDATSIYDSVTFNGIKKAIFAS